MSYSLTSLESSTKYRENRPNVKFLKGEPSSPPSQHFLPLSPRMLQELITPRREIGRFISRETDSAERSADLDSWGSSKKTLSQITLE